MHKLALFFLIVFLMGCGDSEKTLEERAEDQEREQGEQETDAAEKQKEATEEIDDIVAKQTQVLKSNPQAQDKLKTLYYELLSCQSQTQDASEKQDCKDTYDKKVSELEK